MSSALKSTSKYTILIYKLLIYIDKFQKIVDCPETEPLDFVGLGKSRRMRFDSLGLY